MNINEKHYEAVLNVLVDDINDLKLELKRLEKVILLLTEKLVKTCEELRGEQQASTIAIINELRHQNIKTSISSTKPTSFLFKYPFQNLTPDKRFSTKLDKKRESEKETETKDEPETSEQI